MILFSLHRHIIKILYVATFPIKSLVKFTLSLSLLGKLCALFPNLFVENNLKHSGLACSIPSRFSFFFFFF